MKGLFDYPTPTAAQLARYAKRPTLRLTRRDRTIAQDVQRILKRTNGLSVEDVQAQAGICNHLRARAFLSHLEVEGKAVLRNGLWVAK